LTEPRLDVVGDTEKLRLDPRELAELTATYAEGSDLGQRRIL